MKTIKYFLTFVCCIVLLAGCTKPTDPASSTDTTVTNYTASEIEIAVIEEINFARTNPKDYVTQRLSNRYKSNSSESYKKALDEVIDQMQRMKALPELVEADGLCKCAAEWVNVSGPQGTVGHDSNISARFKKYCTYATLGENCSYGYSTAQDIVAELLIDDGVETRGHRQNILSASFTYVGVAIGNHKKYKTMCCIDFASGYKEK